MKRVSRYHYNKWIQSVKSESRSLAYDLVFRTTVDVQEMEIADASHLIVDKRGVKSILGYGVDHSGRSYNHFSDVTCRIHNELMCKLCTLMGENHVINDFNIVKMLNISHCDVEVADLYYFNLCLFKNKIESSSVIKGSFYSVLSHFYLCNENYLVDSGCSDIYISIACYYALDNNNDMKSKLSLYCLKDRFPSVSNAVSNLLNKFDNYVKQYYRDPDENKYGPRFSNYTYDHQDDGSEVVVKKGAANDWIYQRKGKIKDLENFIGRVERESGRAINWKNYNA